MQAPIQRQTTTELQSKAKIHLLKKGNEQGQGEEIVKIFNNEACQIEFVEETFENFPECFEATTSTKRARLLLTLEEKQNIALEKLCTITNECIKLKINKSRILTEFNFVMAEETTRLDLLESSINDNAPKIPIIIDSANHQPFKVMDAACNQFSSNGSGEEDQESFSISFDGGDDDSLTVPDDEVML
jgi:hypothetical protein